MEHRTALFFFSMLIFFFGIEIYGLPRWGLIVKHLPASAGNTGDGGSIPGLGRSPGVGHGNTLQYSCLENPTNREACRVPWGCKELDVTACTLVWR